MEPPEKIISLHDRRRRREGDARQEPERPAAEDSGAPASGDEPVPARLTWLFCPQCNTLEYTEVVVPGGRVHNRCGTRVEEAVLDIDARAENTIVQFNLERIAALTDYLAAQRQRFLEYRERLRRMVGDPGTRPLTEEALKTLPVGELDALGLLVPKALSQPRQHFRRPEDHLEATDEPPAPEPGPSDS